ncbi:MAG: RNA-guided endonuclease InsQ/TnpB family protein [Ktedonobacterales bacterium]
METVSIYPLTTLRPSLRRRLYQAQREAARVWTMCRDLHLAARQQHTPWPDREELQYATKGRFALHSQSVQMVCHQFLANVEATRELRRTNRKIRYPYKDKRFFALYWPAQAVSVERRRIVLPMGRSRQSLVFKLDLPERIGSVKLVWKDGYELHVSIPVTPGEAVPGPVQATVDLGEIHQAAVTTNTGVALVVSGRGIRSLKRRHHMALGQLARKRSRCTRGSRRWRKLQRARRQVSARTRRQVRALRHQGTRKVIAFCQQHQVGRLFIGNPQGVRQRTRGRHHNQRLSGWEYGRDLAYLTSKAKAASIESFTGSERGTSSQCPVCGWKHKVKGRVWRCRNPQCAFVGHRDVVGSVNMHPLAFGTTIAFPARITYQRAGPVRVRARNKQSRLVGSQPARCRRPDTGHQEDVRPFALVLSGSASRATT